MRIYASRKQTEMIIVALVKQYGVADKETVKLLETINKCLALQCQDDKAGRGRKSKKNQE